jgi:hypothetical protein
LGRDVSHSSALQKEPSQLQHSVGQAAGIGHGETAGIGHGHGMGAGHGIAGHGMSAGHGGGFGE